MIKVCNICSPRRFYWIHKIHKCIYTQRERERERERERIRKSSWKEFWRFPVNGTNFGSISLVKICMHQIYDVWNFVVTNKVCVHYFYFCYQNKTFKELSKMFYQKISFCPRDYLTSVLHSSPLFSFLGHCWFYRRSWLMINFKVYDILMFLNWILKTQIF